LVFFGIRKVKIVLDYSSYALIFTYIILLITVWYNKELKGMNIITLGIVFNFVVIVANGGYMPVLLSSLYKAGLNDFALILKEGSYVTHTLITEKTLAAFLADVIPLPSPFPDPSVISFGDFLMFCGVFSLIQNTMLKKELNPEENEQNSEARIQYSG
jgi:intracellular septation protein A